MVLDFFECFDYVEVRLCIVQLAERGAFGLEAGLPCRALGSHGRPRVHVVPVMGSLPFPCHIDPGTHPHSNWHRQQSYRPTVAVRLGKEHDEDELKGLAPLARLLSAVEDSGERLKRLIREAFQGSGRKIV